MKHLKIAAVILIILISGFCLWKSGSRNPGDVSFYRIVMAAGQGYGYGYPLVLMDASMRAMADTANYSGVDSGAAVNRMFNTRVFPDAGFRAVVRPNLDTLYSIAWLDLSGDALVMEMPDMGKKYYLFPVMDAWTNVFATPGTRTTGSGPARYLIAGPEWKGRVPDGMTLYSSPTVMAWILGRIQTDGADDYAAVHALQDKISLTPLSDYLQGARNMSVVVDVSSGTDARPSHIVADLRPRDFFERLAGLMDDNPPPAEDAPALKELKLLGVVPGDSAEMEELGFIARFAVNIGVRTARKMLGEAVSVGARATREGYGSGVEEQYSVMGSLSQVMTRNGWSVALKDIGNYGVNYAFRAGVALIGLGANLPEDAVYYNAAVDIEDKPLDARRNYILHFDAGNLPPVKAFWSVTLYDSEGFLVKNPINRFALTDRDPLNFNDDGSLTIYIQNKSPGAHLESNWLPAPDSGPINLTARLYRPRDEVLAGEWFMPGVLRSESAE